jgi:hypothetical protein
VDGRGDTRNDAQRSGGDSEQWMGLSSRNVSRGRGDRRGRVHVCGRGRGRGGGLVANHDRGGGSGGGASDSDNFDAKIDDEVDRVGSEARQEGVVVAKTSTEDMIVLSAIALTRESLVNHTEHQKNEHAGPTSKSPLHIALNLKSDSVSVKKSLINMKSKYFFYTGSSFHLAHGNNDSHG